MILLFKMSINCCNSRYISDPSWYTQTAQAVRKNLDAAGLTSTKQHVTEWFPCILCKAQDSDDGAAAFGASLTNMIHAGVSLATLYPACSLDEGNKTGGHGWGLFDVETEPGHALWRPLTYTYLQFGELMQSTPHEVMAVTSGPAEAGFTVLAGRSEATGAAALKILILIASRQSNSSAIQVGLQGMPPLKTMRYSVVLTNQSVVLGVRFY